MMADATSSIFNKKATEKLRSPDDLDKYVQVTNPGVWVVLLACIALLVGLLAWGVFGTVEADVSVSGVVISEGDEATPLCFLTEEEIDRVSEGNDVIMDDVPMTVAAVDSVPVSAGEADSLLNSDYLSSALVRGDWVYIVTFDGDTSELAQNVPVPVKITVDRVPPISLIFRSRG